MLSIEPVNADEFRKALKVLNMIEPTTTKDLRDGLKQSLQAFATQVANGVPPEPPLSGFNHNGPTRWGTVKGTVSFTPGRGSKSATSLVSIRVTGRFRGFYIAEMAGMRGQYSDTNRGYTRNSLSGPVTVRRFETTSGRALVRELNGVQPMKGKGGRYAYSKFRLLRPDVVQAAIRILSGTMAKLEMEL